MNEKDFAYLRQKIFEIESSSRAIERTFERLTKGQQQFEKAAIAKDSIKLEIIAKELCDAQNKLSNLTNKRFKLWSEMPRE